MGFFTDGGFLFGNMLDVFFKRQKENFADVYVRVNTGFRRLGIFFC